MRKLTILLALLLCFAMLMSACGAPAAEEEAAAPEAAEAAEPAEEVQARTLTVGTQDAADGFDPTVNSNCGLGLMLVYDTILYRDPETGVVGPMLAESYEWADETTLVLEIREGVKFSNGETMTPEDVLFSLQRFVTENTQFDPGYDNIDFENSTIDGNTLTLKLFTAAPNLTNSLANDRWASVLCKSYIESSDADAFWDKPVGTGPYTCVENLNGSHSTYQLRDDYWGDMPEAETITVRHYSELTTMMVDFENGVLDIALDVGETDYNLAIEGAYGDDVVGKLYPTYDILAVTMPEYVEVLDDINVRKAIALALDTAGITQAVYGSLGTVADSSLIPGVEGYKSVGVNEYDPEQAKQLLADAGYAEGDISLLMVFPSMPANDKAATIVQAMLAEVGINISVESGDFATVIPRLMNNECELSLFGTGGGTYTATDIYATVGATSTNAGARCTDETFNEYLTSGSTEMDPELRAENYNKAQDALAETYRFVPIAWSNAANIYHDNVDNVIGTVARSISLRYVTFN